MLKRQCSIIEAQIEEKPAGMYPPVCALPYRTRTTAPATVGIAFEMMELQSCRRFAENQTSRIGGRNTGAACESDGTTGTLPVWA